MQRVRYLGFFVLLFAAAATGQEFRATITGRVLDSSEAAVAGATVTATNVDTNETSTARTDASGVYTIPLLRPGKYTLMVEAAGFKKYVREGITLQVAQTAGINISLEVGNIAETVSVSAEAPLLETETADHGGVVDTQAVAELPLNARNPYMLGAVMSGVTFNGSAIWQRPFDNGAIAQWSINGGWQSNNEFLLDGAPNDAQAGGNNVAYVAIVDAVQEFRVQTNTYDAQYGHTGGGVMNVILKSGTNEFHATGWEFMRRTPFDANTFQNNAVHAPKSTHYLDQFGGQFDGPVVIPWLYSGKNKTFFLASIEGYREGSPAPLLDSVPEPEFLQGDFGKLTNAAGQPVTIYNPFTGRADPSAPSGWVRDPFPGNIIPPSLINPVAQKILGYFPKPNTTTPGSAYSFQDLSLPNYFDTDTFYNMIYKVDQNFGDKTRMFFRYAGNSRTEHRAVNGITTGPGMDGQLPFQRINNAAVVDWTRTISPSLVVDVRGSFTRFIETGDGAGNLGFDLTSLGFPASLANALPGPKYFGRYDFDGYNALGRYLGLNTTNEYALTGGLTKVAGSHTIHTGLDVRRIHYLIGDTGNVLYFRSRTDFTQRVYNQGDSTSGNALASFLLGLPASDSNVNFNAYPFFRQWYYAPFVQDDWKATRRLTLNLGLRWDFNLAPDEKYGRLNYQFDTTLKNPVSGQVDPSRFPQFANLAGGLTFAGVNGNPSKPAHTYWKAIQPRIGAAFELTRRVIIRGGYGMYYLNPSNDWMQTTGFSTQNPLIASLDGGRTPARPDLLSNPYPNGLQPPTGSSLGPLTYVGRNFTWFNPDFILPRQDQFSLGIQVLMPHQSMLDVSYIGSRGYNYEMNRAANLPSLQFREQCNILEGGSPNFCNEQVDNPFQGNAAFQGTSFYSAAKLSRYQLARPFPQFNGDLQEDGINQGRTWYNSAQINYRAHIGSNLNLLANYTFSKFIERWGYLDQLKNIYQEGPYFLDRPNVIKLSATYQLPFGRGKMLGSALRGVLGKVASGWEANTFLTTESGIPANLPGNVQMLHDPAVQNVNWHQSQVRLWSNCVLRMDNNGNITPQAYSLAAGCGADQSRYDWLILPSYAPNVNPYRAARIRMPHVTTMDASLNKTTHITERLALQFRAEAFNILNHYTMPLQNINTNPNDANFGSFFPAQVSTVNSGYPRQIQLGFKLLW